MTAELTRQRRWQLKQRALGKCIKCGEPKVTAQFCRDHADKRNKYTAKFSKKPSSKARQSRYDTVRKAKCHYGEFWECQVLILQLMRTGYEKR